MSSSKSWLILKIFMLVDLTSLIPSTLMLMVLLGLGNHSLSGALLMLSKNSLKMNCRAVILLFDLHPLELQHLIFMAGQLIMAL